MNKKELVENTINKCISIMNENDDREKLKKIDQLEMMFDQFEFKVEEVVLGENPINFRKRMAEKFQKEVERTKERNKNECY